jgi:hypothetical protein
MKGKVPFDHSSLNHRKLDTAGEIYIGIQGFARQSSSFPTINLYRRNQFPFSEIVINLLFEKLSVAFPKDP